MGQETVLF